jgi:hypothetical protein
LLKVALNTITHDQWWNNDSIKAFVRCTSISNVLVCSSRVNFYLFHSSQQQKSSQWNLGTQKKMTW